MIILEPRNMHWILEPEIEDHDLCAHGDIHFEVNQDVLVDENDGPFTVSGAALFLLRTLEKDYIAKNEDENLIFPCCGFDIIPYMHSDNCFILGCPHGIDFDVLHRRGNKNCF